MRTALPEPFPLSHLLGGAPTAAVVPGTCGTTGMYAGYYRRALRTL